MTREEELDWLCRLRSEIYVYMPKEWLIPMNNALDMAISDLSAEPCDDCISRKDAIQALKAEGLEELFRSLGVYPWNVIKMIPSVHSKYPNDMGNVSDGYHTLENKGEWIYDKSIYNWRCSRCGQTPPTTGYVGKADFMATHFKFCSHCGAKVIVNGNCMICGKPLTGNNLFICEECQKIESEET